jgi:GPI-anchor transamidase subunit GAA1
LLELIVDSSFCFLIVQVLQIVVLLELGTALIAVSMINFSLGFILSIIIGPFALLVRSNGTAQVSTTKWMRFNQYLSRFVCFLLHPLNAVCLAVLGITYATFPEMVLNDIVKRAFTATMDAITFSVVDSLVNTLLKC